LNVPGTEDIQPASFAGGSADDSGSPATGDTTPTPGSYGSGSYTPPAQTAEQDSPYTYPDTYRR
jgi:hypothetical protein